MKFANTLPRRIQSTPFWAPVVDGIRRLEYGLWPTRTRAIAAAHEVMLFSNARSERVDAIQVWIAIKD